MPASLVLCLALIGISFAGPLVRLSHAHPLAIAIWRLGFSLVIIAIALVATGSWRQWRRLDRRGLVVAVGAGTMLAFHFWTWNASIGLTTVAASVVLVNMQPALVALLSAGWLHEPPSRRQWLGIGIAMAGAFVVALPDMASETHAASGRALLGAFHLRGRLRVPAELERHDHLAEPQARLVLGDPAGELARPQRRHRIQVEVGSLPQVRDERLEDGCGVSW